MKYCPNCAASLEDNAQFCSRCGQTQNPGLGTPSGQAPATPDPSMVYPGQSVTSGKAIASLICGIFGIFFPSAIVAVILGHLSLSDIRRSAGRLTGRGMAIAGLIFGYLGLAIIPVLIIAAIAIPNLLRARMAANEASAVGSLRAINTSCVAYATEYKSFPPSLANLGPGRLAGAGAAGLIDGALASGVKSGYQFTYEQGVIQDGAITSYQVHADPVTPGTTGSRHFFTDETQAIRAQTLSPADASSPVLD